MVLLVAPNIHISIKAVEKIRSQHKKHMKLTKVLKFQEGENVLQHNMFFSGSSDHLHDERAWQWSRLPQGEKACRKTQILMHSHLKRLHTSKNQLLTPHVSAHGFHQDAPTLQQPMMPTTSIRQSNAHQLKSASCMNLKRILRTCPSAHLLAAKSV